MLLRMEKLALQKAAKKFAPLNSNKRGERAKSLMSVYVSNEVNEMFS